MSAWEQEKEEKSREIIELAYETNCIETIFNAEKKKHRYEGWILKNGTNSIYFINFRKGPGAPKLMAKLGYVMGQMAIEEIPKDERDWFVGVEMAGIPIVQAMSTAHYILVGHATGDELRAGYTRPFTQNKIRTVGEAVEELGNLRENLERLGKWGSHRLVEADYEDGARIVIVDDMVTGGESKLIAREVINFDLEQRGLTGYSGHALVGIDRLQGAYDFLKKEGIELHCAAPMNIEWLEGVMPAEQYEHLERFVQDPSLYQDVGRDPKEDRTKGENSPYMQEALDLARRVT